MIQDTALMIADYRRQIALRDEIIERMAMGRLGMILTARGWKALNEKECYPTALEAALSAKGD